MIGCMNRPVLLVASPRLANLLAEQFEAQGFPAPRTASPREVAERAPSFHAIVLDDAVCDAPALADRLRVEGFDGAIALIDAEAAAADAAFARPVRFADLIAVLAASSRRPRADDALRLTEKEAAILARLEQAQGAVIPKAELLADVWGYGPNVVTRTLETHIHRLRRKLEEQAHPLILSTEDGGYRLFRRGEP